MKTQGAKSVVITGSTRGIGFCMAREFLKAGSYVLVSGRSEKNLNIAREKLKEWEGRVVTRLCDVTTYQDIEALWRVAEDQFGRVDIWINNAGVAQDSHPVWDLDPSDVSGIITTNVTGLIHGTQIAFRGMSEQGCGQIFNMEGFGSDGRWMKNLGVYGTSKRAVRYFTHAFREEARQSCVLVGTLSPGMMATDFLLTPLRKDPEKFRKSLRVLTILADKPETVARYLVVRILANKRQGAHFAWPAFGKILWRFVTAPFLKRKIF